MNHDRRLFQLYLLGQMRNHAAVQAALDLLGASKEEMSSARLRMIDAGLEQPVVPFGAYERLLGEPVEQSQVPDNDEYKQVRLAFGFDLWPTMHVVVLGSPKGAVGSVRFERAVDHPDLKVYQLGTLNPWQVARTDLVRALWKLSTRDEWYPMLDVEAEPPSSSTKALLQFDFELLQAVHPLTAATNSET